MRGETFQQRYNERGFAWNMARLKQSVSSAWKREVLACERAYKADLAVANERASVAEAELKFWRTMCCNGCSHAMDCDPCEWAAQEAIRVERM